MNEPSSAGCQRGMWVISRFRPSYSSILIKGGLTSAVRWPPSRLRALKGKRFLHVFPSHVSRVQMRMRFVQQCRGRWSTRPGTGGRAGTSTSSTTSCRRARSWGRPWRACRAVSGQKSKQEKPDQDRLLCSCLTPSSPVRRHRRLRRARPGRSASVTPP